MRVDAPTDSTVATRRRVASRSGARLPNAFHAPLNSSISPTSRRRSEVSTRFFKGSIRISANIPVNTHNDNRVFAGIFSDIADLENRTLVLLSGAGHAVYNRTRK